MSKPNSIRQGESFGFTVTVSGDETLTGTYEVKQYPGDTATLTGSLTQDGAEYTGTLSSTDTASLDIGQWFIFSEFIDSDENISNPNKLYISKGW